MKRRILRKWRNAKSHRTAYGVYAAHRYAAHFYPSFVVILRTTKCDTGGSDAAD